MLLQRSSQALLCAVVLVTLVGCATSARSRLEERTGRYLSRAQLAKLEEGYEDLSVHLHKFGNVLAEKTKYHKLGKNHRWMDALKLCEGKGLRACTYKEICKNGPGKPPVFGRMVGTFWTPVSDLNNDWTGIGNDVKHMCHRHTKVFGHTPSWGRKHSVKSWKGHVACCPGTTMKKLKNPKSSWDMANEHCAKLMGGHGRVCDRKHYCADGPGEAPIGGLTYQAAWAASYEFHNEWVAIGYTFPKKMRCKTHTEIAGRLPDWGKGTTGTTLRGFVRCCPDKFWTNLPGGPKTWKEANAHCTSKKMRLCQLNEYCAQGAGKAPRGGARPHVKADAWAPIGNGENAWVNVGSKTAANMCQSFAKLNGGKKPAWGEKGGHRGHIQCCSGEVGKKATTKKPAQGESSKADTGKKEGAKSESSGSNTKEQEQKAKRGNEQASKEAKKKKNVESEQKAKAEAKQKRDEEQRKAAERAAKAKAREQAAKLRQHVAARKAALDEHIAKVNRHAQQVEEQRMKEALKKARERAYKIKMRAFKKGQRMVAEAHEKKLVVNPSSVWTALPTVPELGAHGFRANGGAVTITSDEESDEAGLAEEESSEEAIEQSSAAQLPTEHSPALARLIAAGVALREESEESVFTITQDNDESAEASGVGDLEPTTVALNGESGEQAAPEFASEESTEEESTEESAGEEGEESAAEEGAAEEGAAEEGEESAGEEGEESGAAEEGGEEESETESS